MRLKLLCALVLCTVPAAAAPAWNVERAIIAAREICPKDLPIRSWSAALQGDKWEVRGRGAATDVIVNIPVTSDRPLLCAVMRAPPPSSLRAL